jgi:hypothetical protein
MYTQKRKINRTMKIQERISLLIQVDKQTRIRKDLNTTKNNKIPGIGTKFSITLIVKAINCPIKRHNW